MIMSGGGGGAWNVDVGGAIPDGGGCMGGTKDPGAYDRVWGAEGGGMYDTGADDKGGGMTKLSDDERKAG